MLSAESLWDPLALAAGQVLLAMGVLAVILATGRRIGQRLQLRLWGVPEALVAGILGLLVSPSGLVPLLPEPLMALWAELPLVLLTLVFGSLMLGKPLPQLKGLWRPVTGQVSLALVLGLGQYVVGGLVVLLVLQPWLGVPSTMACLIEVAYEGGHGSAAAMGASYAALGFPGGQDLGLAMATVGLLSSTLVGGVLVVVGRQKGWLLSESLSCDLPAPGQPSGGMAGADADHPHPAWALWAVNLAMVGVAVMAGLGLLHLLRLGTDAIGGGVASVGQALPVFPLAIIGSLLIRWLLQRCQLTHWASAPIQSEIGTLSADLLITSATACLNLALLAADWLPLTVLALSGLVWNLGVTLLLAPRLLPADWFERAILEFGQATGVAASGLLLLRMADPEDHSEALPAFSLKQLLLQPFLAGGVVTVVAPLGVAGWGLPAWTGFCLAFVLLAGGAGLLIAQLGRDTQASALQS